MSAFESTLTSWFSGTFSIKHPNNGQTPFLFSLSALLERAADSVSESASAMCRGATDGTAGSLVLFSRRWTQDLRPNTGHSRTGHGLSAEAFSHLCTPSPDVLRANCGQGA